MEDQNINTKIVPIPERALKIFCATKVKRKKEVVEMALAKHVPAEFFGMAEKEIEKEGNGSGPNN